MRNSEMRNNIRIKEPVDVRIQPTSLPVAFQQSWVLILDERERGNERMVIMVDEQTRRDRKHYMEEILSVWHDRGRSIKDTT